MITMPQDRPQKPAITVATIAGTNPLPSMRAPRMVLRRMMKGAAKTRNGTAASAFGLASFSKRKLAGRSAKI